MRRYIEPALSMSSGSRESGIREKNGKPFFGFKRSEGHRIFERIGFGYLLHSGAAPRSDHATRLLPVSRLHAAYAEAPDGTLAVDLDRSDAEAKLKCNVFCHDPVGDEQEHLPFARRQRGYAAGGIQSVGDCRLGRTGTPHSLRQCASY